MAPSTAGCRVATRLLALVHLDRDARRGDQPLGSGGGRCVDGHAPGVEAVLQDEGGGDDGAAVDGQIVERCTRPGEPGPERVEAGALRVVERRRGPAGSRGPGGKGMAARSIRSIRPSRRRTRPSAFSGERMAPRTACTMLWSMTVRIENEGSLTWPTKGRASAMSPR